MFELLGELNKLRPLLSGKDKWKFVALFGLMIVGSLMEALGIAAIPVYITMIMDPSKLSQNRWVGEWFAGMPDEITLNLLFWASALLFGFVVIKNLFLTFVYFAQFRIIATQRVKLTDHMFRLYQSAPFEWHLQRSSSEFLRNIQVDTTQVLSNVILPFLNLAMAFIMSCVIVTMLLVSTPGITFLSLAVTAIGLLFIIRFLQTRLRKIGEVTRVELMEQTKAIQQGFGSLVDTRIIGCEEYLSTVHKDSLKKITKMQAYQQVVQRATPYAIESFTVLGLLVILVPLVMKSESLSSVLPVIALLGIVMVRLKQIASQVATSFNQINSARVYVPAVVHDLKELEAAEQERNAFKSDVRMIKSFHTLKLKDVSFAYAKTTEPAIRDITLELKRGESIAFVGATGCGKSTLANIILGLLKPKSGSILVNDIAIVKDMKGWRNQLGYIQQSVYLLDDTIRANVAFGMPKSEVNENQLWSALNSACLVDFIKSLPEGLETVIGEGGVRLSGGQRQRLGIARALYPDPEVLVMDEATSALDNKTEETVMQAIQNLKQNRTLIMIAHRLSTVEDCDQLYYLRDGRIEISDTYEKLITESSAFREMARSKA